MRRLALNKESVADLTPADLANVAGGIKIIPQTGDYRDCIKTYHPWVDELALAMQSRSC